MFHVCIIAFESMWAWILSIHLYALPLHEGLVHSLLSWWGPLHSAQPCTDALQRLCLCWVPVLQVTLHLDHGPHSNHWPSTGRKEMERKREKGEGVDEVGRRRILRDMGINWFSFWREEEEDVREKEGTEEEKRQGRESEWAIRKTEYARQSTNKLQRLFGFPKIATNKHETSWFYG